MKRTCFHLYLPYNFSCHIVICTPVYQRLKTHGLLDAFQQQEQDPTNLYIANLPLYMTENDLETMFTPYGQVISTRILRDNNGISRGVGFCRMESKDKCEQIIQAYNGKILPGKCDCW